MQTAKEEVKSILSKLPEDCSFEDIQYHIYVAEKIQKGIERASTEGTISQDDIEKKFSKWISK